MAGKMTKCKTCNADVSTTAESCPQCGAKLKRKMGCLGKLFIVGLIIVVLGVIAVASMSTGVEQQKAQIEESLPISDLAFETLDEIYNLKSTYTELQKNEEWKKYQDKKINWTGEVSAIGEMLGTMTLQVKMKPESFTSDLLIRLKESEREKALKLKIGDEVAFVGVCEWGSILPITLNEGEIVISASSTNTEVEPQEAPTEAPPISDVTFEMLDEIYNLKSTYTELQKNEEWKKYQDKNVNWTGEVSAIGEMLGTMTLQVKMKPESFGSDLLIRLKESEREKALKFKVGDKVTFAGVLAEWGSLLPITLNDGVIVIN